MTLAPRVEAAIARLEALGDAAAREAGRAAVAALLDYHAEALRRLFARLHEAGAGERLLEEVAADEVVASLLLLHDLAPSPGRAPADRDGTLVPVDRLTRRADVGHERCDLCAQPLASGHAHLFEVEQRRLQCACAACSLLFDAPGTKLRRVRPRAERLDGFRMSEAQWAALGVPVGLAFLSYSSLLGEVVAAYPGPAGITEAPVPMSAWREIASANPALAALEPDVAALLVDRLGGAASYHVLSIDECYRLAGLVRRRWEGLTGGAGPLRAVREFLEALPEAAR